MNFTCLLFGVLFLLAGILFAYGLLHTHLAAWKEMPKEEQEKVKIRELCHNIGGMIALCGLVFLFAGLFPAFQEHLFVWSMILWLILGGIDVYYIEKSSRYYKK